MRQLEKVIFDYSKCEGIGECVDVCPVEVLEVSENGNWCKPVDDEVDNEDAVDQFYDEVNDEEDSVDIVIENEMPECVACMACEATCPQEAITIEE